MKEKISTFLMIDHPIAPAKVEGKPEEKKMTDMLCKEKHVRYVFYNCDS